MPCQPQLLRLRDSRRTLHHIFRHAVTYSPHQVRYESSPADESARLENARLEARLATLKRLDQHINPDDLSATLEAHRDANRASIIRRVHSSRADPDVLRPSILDTRPPVRVNRKSKQPEKETEGEERKKDKSPLTVFSRIVPRNPDETNDAAAFQLRSLERVAQATQRQATKERQQKENEEQYQRWVGFLTKHEDPLQPIPKYRDDDRAAFFTVLRRAFAIIREEQVRLSTTGLVEDLAPQGFLAHYGFAQPIVAGLRGYPRPEPWSRRPTRQGKDYHVKNWLNTEIKAFANWMEMTPSENAARAKLCDILIDLAQKASPGLQAETFGSQSTGLTMPNSDIDIRITDPTYKKAPYEGEPEDKTAKAAWAAEQMALRKQRMVSHLRVIQGLLAKHEDFDQVEINGSAYFPLVRAVHKPTSLKVQIVSTKPTYGAREATKKYLAEFSQLKRVFLLLKATLNLRNLSDPWFGGIGSYTLFMMCVAALKHGSQRNKPKMESPAISLLYTLDFWAKFDIHREGLSIEPFVKFPKISNQSWQHKEARKTDTSLWARHRIAIPSIYKPWMLHLQDPADPYNDLGRSALAIKDIQATFKQLYHDLIWEMEDPKRKEDATPLLRRFVGNSERYFDEMRIPVDLWGSQFVEENAERELQGQSEGEDVVDVDEAASRDVSEEEEASQDAEDAVATLRHMYDRTGSEKNI
ncbi:hypothetical protein KCV07_g6298, partial [Aureobasidium melanogenum]